ncbi:Polyisoprenoid-binding protein YceI [Edaphobacillus lindanitolerans]|uniref:Polyisoprenoid-binding protein YceI n=1 Tax=Edaphobacillus lindanitolerans TaxID=550447 RepID=A0A1U7PP80_9BACI|nr:Polyisoprenoid-binding protein YceI [Edaphobacillus lindanitolerans]
MANSKWQVDAAHSHITFTVKHMMISKVRGSFSKFDAEIDADPENLTGASISFNIEVPSIDTDNEDRDNHLRSADFFDAEQYPEIRFKSTEIRQTADGEYDVKGDLTIKGTTKQVVFEAEYGGRATNPWGQEVVAFEAEGKINRKDFGLTWNQALETGGVLVGEDVKLKIELEATAGQPDTAEAEEESL